MLPGKRNRSGTPTQPGATGSEQRTRASGHHQGGETTSSRKIGVHEFISSGRAQHTYCKKPCAPEHREGLDPLRRSSSSGGGRAGPHRDAHASTLGLLPWGSGFIRGVRSFSDLPFPYFSTALFSRLIRSALRRQRTINAGPAPFQETRDGTRQTRLHPEAKQASVTIRRRSWLHGWPDRPRSGETLVQWDPRKHKPFTCNPHPPPPSSDPWHDAEYPLRLRVDEGLSSTCWGNAWIHPVGPHHVVLYPHS